jgi:hypothetical protein
MKIRITQTGLREFTDVYEFDLNWVHWEELKRNLRESDRTLNDIEESDAYDLGFELTDPVESELGDIVEDSAETEFVRTKKKMLEAAQ